MNRSQFVRNFLLTFVVMLGLAGISASAQTAATQLSSREMASIRTAAARPAATSFWAVTQDFEGNFDTVDAQMATFEREARAQKIPNANPVGILVLYEDPTGKSQFRMAVGIALTRKAAVKAPLKAERMSFSEAVSVTHVGSYNELERVHGAVESAVKERYTRMAKGARARPAKDPSWPVVLKLLSDPKRVKSAQRRTQMIVPVK